MKRLISSIVLMVVCLGTVLVRGLYAQDEPKPLRMAVFPFEVADPSDKTLADDARTITNIVRTNLVQYPQYEVMTREDIDKLIKENQFQISRLTSNENLSTLKMKNINYLAVGNINILRRRYIITMNLLDISTGQYVYSQYNKDSMDPDDPAFLTDLDQLTDLFIRGVGKVIGGKAPLSDYIQVTTGTRGTLSFQGMTAATLDRGGSFPFPIRRPGTYLLKMRFDNGREITKDVTILELPIIPDGVRKIEVGMPPAKPANVQVNADTPTADSLNVLWTGSVGITYTVYYNTEDKPDTAQACGTISGTSITVEDLEIDKQYYFWVTATSEEGFESDKSGGKSGLTGYAIGKRGPAGGLIFYDKGNDSGGWRYLEAAPSDVGPAQWGAYASGIYNKEVGKGRDNTLGIIIKSRQLGETEKAAQLCNEFKVDWKGKVYDDWFLPTQGELDLMYQNLFKKELGGFKYDWYWTSSEFVSNAAYAQQFSTGRQTSQPKTEDFGVRPIRAF
ncbi:MAG: fibronectin type III domain-containing protein [Treponema sp.]|jgi:TolB-like protein|nr:fibronectin type III domain-containing protein [Treponema sp.]